MATAAGPPPAFDLGVVVRSGFSVSDEDTARRLTDPRSEERSSRRKVKLRWRCQPLEGGPRFEVGTYGSRKGVMKSKLLHVAMDWAF
ncbi:MAG: hypothetical protein P8Y58_03285 [Novosphingobium sp.]